LSGFVRLAALALALAAPRAIAPQENPEPTWHEVSRGGVAVRFAPGDSLAAERFLVRLLSQTRLPALPAGVPARATAYLAPDEAAFRSLTGGRVPHWGAGVALPQLAVMVIPAYASARSSPGDDAAVARHEWAHLGLHEYLPGLQVPRWFDEGYARWAEGAYDASEAWRLRLLLALGRAPPLDSLSLDWPADQASAEVAYLLAASTVAYLIEESGERGVAMFLERWRAGGSFEDALRSTYGVTSGQLEGDWRNWVKRRYGWLLVVSHSAVFWTAAGIALLLAGVGRRRWSRERMARLRAGEPGEEPAYWVEELTIRPYEADDHAAVWELHNLGLHQVGTHAGVGPWDDDLSDIPSAYLRSGGDFLVGLVEERIVAMGAYRRISDDEAEVKRMRVHPDYQRRGFGQGLLTALEMRARAVGYRTLRLDTTLKQNAARALYIKNGYVEVRRQPWRDTELVYYSKDLKPSGG
jgi:GNAT superfamily N-acetyltransferase